MRKHNSDIGKFVASTRYLHISAVDALDDKFRHLLKQSLALTSNKLEWNVVKFDLTDSDNVSLLLYTDFYEYPFPELLQSTKINLKSKTVRFRSYSKSNPPILHRKEALLLPSDPSYDDFSRLTHRLEQLGAFKEMHKFGTKQHWNKRLSELGIEVINHNAFSTDLTGSVTTSGDIKRHRTALKRKKLSSCMGALLDTSLVNQGTKIFDYGCGRGDDIAILKKNKFCNVSGWDPYFFPSNPIPKSADYVSLSFVINVIENPLERHQVLKNAFKIARKALVLSVMLEHQADLQFATPMNDGFVNSIKTFQKYYSGREIFELIQQELGEDPIKLAAGVYIVFKDKNLEQEYRFKRQIGLITQASTLGVESGDDIYLTPLVKKMREQILHFGRMPKQSELPKQLASEVAKAAVSYTRLCRLALSEIPIAILQEVGEIFASEILIFLAINKFDQRVKYRSLPEKLQNDVKVHFGSLKSAENSANELLFSLSNTSALISSALDAERNGLGRLIGNKFRFHSRFLSKLPLELRLFAKIGERVHRDVGETEIIQLHLESKKMSYLSVTDFDVSPLPRIAFREIVKFSDQEVVKISHEERSEVRILYLKSMYMNNADANLSLQQNFDNQVLALCPDLFADGEPNFDAFARRLIALKISPPQY